MMTLTGSVTWKVVQHDNTPFNVAIAYDSDKFVLVRKCGNISYLIGSLTA
jgi:hypothetical protein